MVNDAERAGAIVVRGATPGCYPAGGTADVEASPSTGAITRATVTISYGDGRQGCTRAGHVAKPAVLVDLLVHELGHALGRTDAYAFPDCEADSVMWSQSRALTRSDKREHQDVYGSRAPFTSARYRVRQVGTTWTEEHTLPGDDLLYRVNSSASYGSIYAVLGWVRQPDPGPPDILKARLFYGSLDTVQALPVETHNPTASALSPQGEAILVYQKEDRDYGSRDVCFRRSTSQGAAFGAEECVAWTTRAGVSAAYDPVSGAFLIGWTASDRAVAVRTIRPSGSPYPSGTTYLSTHKAADAPGIVCAPTYSLLNKNCRLAYADANAYGQTLRRVEFEVIETGGLRLGTVRGQTLYIHEGPAVTWFDDTFQLALTHLGRYVEVYTMPRYGTSWAFSARLTDSGRVSGPALTAEKFCIFSCIEQLYVHWLRYE